MNFISKLEIKSRGKPIEIRDYQFNAVCHALHNKRSVLVSPNRFRQIAYHIHFNKILSGYAE